jgi:hypothetical protein
MAAAINLKAKAKVAMHLSIWPAQEIALHGAVSPIASGETFHVSMAVVWVLQGVGSQGDAPSDRPQSTYIALLHATRIRGLRIVGLDL